MIEFNPALDSTDNAELLKAACTVNGSSALSRGAIKNRGAAGPRPEQYRFALEFVGADGKIYTLNAPPGLPDTGRTQFTCSVATLQGKYMVLELPPHVL